MKYKIGKSKIEGAGKGLLVKKAYRTGEIIGLAHIDDQPATSIGKFHNHSEEPTAGSIQIDNRRYLVAMRDLEPGDEITTNYRLQPELEQPEDFAKGGTVIPLVEDAGSTNEDGFWVPDWETIAMQAKQLGAKTVKTKSGVIIYFDDNWKVQSVDENPQMKKGGTPKSLVKMPKPSKQGLASKKFSKSLEATNRLFTENVLFAKPKSRKRKVFDPGANYQDGGSLPEAEYGMPLGAGMSQNYQGRRKFIHQDGGEPKKRKKDSKGRYRSEDGNIRTPLTPEMQAVMPPEEWGQYVQEVPEVYTTRTREQQDAINAARNNQWLSRENYKRAPHLYLPDGSLRPQAAQAADWVWQLGMTGPAALKGINAAMKIPLGAGVNVGGVLNAGMITHGATQVDDRYQDWQDVAKGEMDWKEAALKTGMTALELSPAYGAAKELLPQTYKINPFAGKLGTYNRVVGQDAVDDILESGLVRVNEDAGVASDLGPFGVIKRTTPYPSFAKALPQKQYANQVIAQGKKPYIISTDRSMKASTLGRHGKGSTQFPIDETGKYMSGFPASEAKIFEFADKPHWLKGYKEVPKELPGSPNNSELIDLWRIQERGAKPMAELAAEGKLGAMFQNEKAIQHFKDREEHFGQWFTNDKADLNWYSKDREFIDPEIINLKVPKNELVNFQNYNKALSRATEREFVIPLSEQQKYLQLPGFKKYQDGGITSQEEIDAGNNAMMKARLAYAYMHGNPAAQRMVVAPDQPYDFGNGMTGTHYMASMDDYAVPQIQEQNGVLELGDYSPDSNEAIRFDKPEDAEYFAENYKQVSPAFEAELTEEEIEEYRRGGWIVEEC